MSEVEIVKTSKPSDMNHGYGYGYSKRYVAICQFCGKEEGLHELWHRNLYSCGCNADAEKAAHMDHLTARRKWGETTPRFSQNSPCPKCGNRIRTAQNYLAGQYHYSQGGFRSNYYEFERIERKCGVCSWEEVQLPHDYDAEVIGLEPKL